MPHPIVVRKRGRQADKGLAAPRHRSTRQVVQLSAGTGDLAGPGALGAHLTEQVHGDAVVDGHHVVVARDDLRRIDELQRHKGNAGVFVHVFVGALRAEGHTGDPHILQIGLLFVGELARLRQVHIGVGAKLRMHAEILQIGLGDQLAQGVGHGTDPQLQRGAAGNDAQDALRDLLLFRGHFRFGKHRKLTVLPFHDHVHIRNADALAVAAAHLRQFLVDLHDHHVGLVQDRLRDARTAGQIKKSVLVHGRGADHGDVDRQKVTVVRRQVAEDHGDEVAEAAVAQRPLVARAVPAVVDEVLAVWVALHGLDGFEDEVAPDLDIRQFVPAGRQGRIQQLGETDVRAVIHPVAALDDLHRLFRGG